MSLYNTGLKGKAEEREREGEAGERGSLKNADCITEGEKLTYTPLHPDHVK